MPIAIALIVSYSICLIVAGHGALPLVAVLFVGGVDSWLIAGKVMGWLGILSLLFATFGLRRKSVAQFVLQLLSSVLLYASWFDIARHTDNESGSLTATAIFSILFQVTFLVSVVWLIVQLKKSRAGSASAP